MFVIHAALDTEQLAQEIATNAGSEEALDELFALITKIDELIDDPGFTVQLRDYFDQVCAEEETP